MTVKENERRLDEHEKSIGKLAAIVVGNGERGMDEVVRDTEKAIAALEKRMDALENAQGITNSELNHFRHVYFDREGLDAMGNPRKKTRVEKILEEIKARFFTAAIIAIIIVVLSHIPEVVTKAIELLP